MPLAIVMVTTKSSGRCVGGSVTCGTAPGAGVSPEGAAGAVIPGTAGS
ncbi:MAG: hypothetical protein QF774_06935 [Nitrospinota bacterium]|nr:hypothetical protein [Nitrospinota bacterium]